MQRTAPAEALVSLGLRSARMIYYYFILFYIILYYIILQLAGPAFEECFTSYVTVSGIKVTRYKEVKPGYSGRSKKT